MDISDRIAAAAGRHRADTLFCNGRIINVFTGELLEVDFAVKDGYVCGFGPYEAKETVDLDGCCVSPGFVDAHVHIESSMVTPAAFARGVIARGTTTVVADPHEIANVLGIAGIEYMIASAGNQMMNIRFAMPSCVPATAMESSGALIDAAETAPLLARNGIVALAEMMNYPGVVHTDADVMAKIRACRRANKPVDGHAPALTGRDLAAYAAAGIASDHECTTGKEALEKIRLGMHIMIREGTCAKNLADLVPVVDDHTWRRMMWCTDDRHPKEILDQGHIDHLVREAVKHGMDPVRAIQMGTINPADYFGLKDVGALAPGRRADFVLFRDLESLQVEKVFCLGEPAADKGRFCGRSRPVSAVCPKAMDLDVSRVDLSIPLEGKRIRIIEAVEDQVVTGHIIDEVSDRRGKAVADPGRDILKIAVIERYSGRAGTGKGFIKGLGLKGGAIASSVAHDSHNIIVAGASDRDMMAAVRAVVEMQGGFAVASDGNITASLALPVAGLMSHDSLEGVNRSMEKVIAAANKLGTSLKDPFMTLGFLALPVIPRLKITDKGLVDVEKFQLVDLFCPWE
ncbi:MAG: adenine deaminase [Desulfobacteraceae bacterium]